MKTLGRVILLIVGICLIAIAIPSIIQSWNNLNASGWKDIGAYPEKLLNLSSLISQSVNVIFGLTALIAVIRGKASFLLSIFSLIMIAGVVWFFINAKNASTLGDWKVILQSVCGFALPIGYFIGSIFIRFK